MWPHNREQNDQYIKTSNVLPAMSDSDVMFCLQSYHGIIIDRLLVYYRGNNLRHSVGVVNT